MNGNTMLNSYDTVWQRNTKLLSMLQKEINVERADKYQYALVDAPSVFVARSTSTLMLFIFLFFHNYTDCLWN